MSEQKPGFGSMFKNTSENENAPIYKGTFTTPSGEQYNISGWIREAKSGVKYMSLAVQVKEEKKEQEKKESPKSGKTSQPISDLPF